MADPALPARPRRLRRLLTAGVAFLLVSAAVVWLAPAVVARTSLRNAVVAKVFADLNGTPTAGGASLGWFAPVVLTDVTVTDPDGKPALTAATVTSSKTLFALLGDLRDLGTFTIDQPVLTVACKPGETNIERAIEKYLTSDNAPPKADRLAITVVVTNGRMVLTEPDGPERLLSEVGVTVTVPKPRTEPVTLSVATTAGGKLDTTWAFGDGTSGAVKADRFTVDSVGPLVRRFAPGTVIGGQLSADLSGKIGTEHTRTAASLDGRASVAGLELAGPWLGADRLKLASAELPVKLAVAHGELQVGSAKLTCDIGTAAFAGALPLDGAMDIDRPGLTANADIDLAKLAAVLPKLLRLKEGTEIRTGRVTLDLTSRPGPDGVVWAGKVATTDLTGVRDGKPLAWQQPLTVEFAGRRRADGLPVFDKLQGQTEFIGFAARGTPEAFDAAANLDLNRLSARLSEFVDLSGLRLEGVGRLDLRSREQNGRYTLSASADLQQFALGDGARSWHEPQLKLTAEAVAVREANGAVRLDAGTVGLTAGSDAARVALLEPVADLRAARTGKLTASANGDLGRWQSRLAGLVALPTGWTAGGEGSVTAGVALTDAGLTAQPVRAELRTVRLRGAELDLPLQLLRGETALDWDRKTGGLTLRNALVTSDAFGLSADRFEIKPTPAGVGAAGAARVNLDLGRLHQALKLSTDPSGADALAGVANGIVALDSGKGPVAFDVKLTGENLRYGLSAKPTWVERSVRLTAIGKYAVADDTLRFTTLKLERDGLTAEAGGSVSKLGTSRDIDLSGILDYDLAKLEPAVRDFLGRGGQLVGTGRKPFQVAGGLTARATGIGGKPSTSLAGLHGTATIGWQAVRAHGFEVGPGELTAKADGGRVTASPVEATFGGGKVRLEPTVSLTSRDYDLSFARGRVVERARLTPAATAGALGYALPAIANAAQADGLVSFDLEDNRIPLVDPDLAAVRGKLTLHTATVSPGPLVTEIATLLGANSLTHTLAKEQVVPVRLEGGRVFHDNFALTVGQSTVRSTGSVGLDGKLALVLDVPVPPKLLDGLKNNPRIRDALAKQTLKVPVGGTLARPALDPRAFNTQADALVKAAAREAGRAGSPTTCSRRARTSSCRSCRRNGARKVEAGRSRPCGGRPATNGSRSPGVRGRAGGGRGSCRAAGLTGRATSPFGWGVTWEAARLGGSLALPVEPVANGSWSPLGPAGRARPKLRLTRPTADQTRLYTRPRASRYTSAHSPRRTACRGSVW
ncbi:MAG: hypothetical protein U0871_03615 [Gemmataceae bacterium]